MPDDKTQIPTLSIGPALPKLDSILAQPGISNTTAGKEASLRHTGQLVLTDFLRWRSAFGSSNVTAPTGNLFLKFKYLLHDKRFRLYAGAPENGTQCVLNCKAPFHAFTSPPLLPDLEYPIFESMTPQLFTFFSSALTIWLSLYRFESGRKFWSDPSVL